MRALMALMLVLPFAAKADEWIPYTDGRAGGCWINATGWLWGCTIPPPPPPPPKRAPQVQYRDRIVVETREPTHEEVNAAASRLLDEQQEAANAAERRAINAEIERRNQVFQEQQSAINNAEYKDWLSKKHRDCDEWLAEQGLEVFQGDVCRSKNGYAGNCPPCPAKKTDP